MRTSLIGITISCSLFAWSAQAQTPTFTAASVVNAASMVAGPIAPGMVANITGSNLGVPSFPENCGTTDPVPTICSGVSVLVNGVAAPVIYDSAAEVTFQVPFNVNGSTATIQVTSNASGHTLSSAVVNVPVAPTAPGIFTKNGTGTGTAYYFLPDVGLFTGDPSPPVVAGQTVAMYGTGFGVTNPAVATGSLGPNAPASATANVTITINNQTVTPTFTGLEPGNLSGAVLGWYQLIFTVPSGLTVPLGQMTASYPVVVTVGGVASPSVNLVVGIPQPGITSTTPNPVPVSASPQTVVFNGSGFESGLTVVLTDPSGQPTNIPASNVTFISSTQFSMQINVGPAVGTWSVVVTNPDGGYSDTFVFMTSTTGPVPTITSIVTTSSNLPQIAQNTWIEIHGNNLSTVTTTWSNSNFSNGLPTTLGNVSVTVDNMPVAIFYVSPTQVNVLAPLDNATGPVTVQVMTPYGQTVSPPVNELQTSPAFFILDLAGHVAALKQNNSLLGPASLDQNGVTFYPATPGETVSLYATGFGQTNPPLTNQLGNVGPMALSLPTLPGVTIGGNPAFVSFAGLTAPGLYQFNVVIPSNAPAGDLPLVATYNGVPTQKGVVITVQ